MLPFWLGEVERILDGDGAAARAVRARRVGHDPDRGDRARPGGAAPGALRPAGVGRPRASPGGCASCRISEAAAPGSTRPAASSPSRGCSSASSPGTSRSTSPSSARSSPTRGGLTGRVHALGDPGRDRARAAARRTGGRAARAPLPLGRARGRRPARPGRPVHAVRRPASPGTLVRRSTSPRPAAVFVAVLAEPRDARHGDRRGRRAVQPRRDHRQRRRDAGRPRAPWPWPASAARAITRTASSSPNRPSAP